MGKENIDNSIRTLSNPSEKYVQSKKMVLYIVFAQTSSWRILSMHFHYALWQYKHKRKTRENVRENK